MTAITNRVSRVLADLDQRYEPVGIGMAALRNFNTHDGMARAAAIAYYSLLSLFPFAMLAVVVVSVIVGQGPELESYIKQIAEQFGLDPATLTTALQGLIDTRPALTVVGIGFLVLALLPWVSTVQRGIVNAFGQARRSYLQTTLASIVLLGMAAVLILLSGVWASLLSLLAGFIERLLAGLDIIDQTVALAISLLPVVVVFLVMTALLRTVPYPRPTVRDVWPGALVTALGFLALRIGFDLYVQLFVADSGNAAGPFGAILVGLLYADFVSITILAGAEVAAATVARNRPPEQEGVSPPG